MLKRWKSDERSWSADRHALIRKKGLKARRIHLQIRRVKMSRLNAHADNRVMPGQLPDLLQFARVDFQFVFELLVHVEIQDGGQLSDARHGFMIMSGRIVSRVGWAGLVNERVSSSRVAKNNV